MTKLHRVPNVSRMTDDEVFFDSALKGATQAAALDLIATEIAALFDRTTAIADRDREAPEWFAVQHAAAALRSAHYWAEVAEMRRDNAD